MFDSVFADVAVGIAVVFFAVASIVSALNEWVSRLLDIRAKVLWKALANALDDNQTDSFTIGLGEALTWFSRSTDDLRPGVSSTPDGRLTTKLANTNLVNALGGATKFRVPGRTKVDDIAPTTFASAMLEVGYQTSNRPIIDKLDAAVHAHRKACSAKPLASDVIEGWLEAMSPGSLADALAGSALSTALAMPIEQSARAWAAAATADKTEPGGEAALDLIAQAVDLNDGVAAAIEALESALHLDALRDLRDLTSGTAVGEVIGSVTRGTEVSVSEIHSAVARWFDAHMVRVSELYKIAARKVLFVAGVILAVGLNISAIDVVDDLRNSSNSRTALNAAVDASCGAPADDIATCKAQLEDLLRTDSDAVSLPLIGDWQSPLTTLGIGGNNTDRDPVLEVLFGWLMTGFAVSFGAPFWFDVVQRLSSYRRAIT